MFKAVDEVWNNEARSPIHTRFWSRNLCGVHYTISLLNVCGLRKGNSLIYLPNGETSKSECGRMIGINQNSAGHTEVSDYPNLNYQLSIIKYSSNISKQRDIKKRDENLWHAECWPNRLCKGRCDPDFRENNWDMIYFLTTHWICRPATAPQTYCF